MKNELGVTLDRNGYAPSIIPFHDVTWCYLCDRHVIQCARHEVFHGAYRSKSKRLGLWVYLCPDCHRLLHNKGTGDRQLKQAAQKAAMVEYAWTVKDFMYLFGKNYI